MDFDDAIDGLNIVDDVEEIGRRGVDIELGERVVVLRIVVGIDCATSSILQ